MTSEENNSLKDSNEASLPPINFQDLDLASKQIKKEYKHCFLSSDDKSVITSTNFENPYQDMNSQNIMLDDNKTIDIMPQSEASFDEIPLSNLIFYSLPSFGKMSCLVLLNVNAMLYYESIGASLLYMSFFVALSRSIEIVLKPFIAHISDELKTNFGRRKPFMVAGCSFYALFLILLFSPPSMSTGTKNISIWFGVFYVLFFLGESVTIVPYLALGPELSSNSKQREKLYFCFYVFQYIGVLFAAASPVLLNRFAFNECDCSICLNNPLINDVNKCIQNCKIMCNVKSNQNSLFVLSLSIGIFFVISIGLLAFKITEKSDSFNKNEMLFIPSLYELINNKPFISLIFPWICDVTIMTIFSTMLPFFLNIIINPQLYCIKNNINLEKSQCSVNYYLGITISVFFICCIFSCGIWHILVGKYGKKNCWVYYSLIAIIPLVLFLFCDLGSTKLLIVAAVLTSFPTSGVYLNDVLVSDAIDYDEFFSGKRNEGIFTVCSAFIPKFVSLFAQAIPLSLMSLIGFKPTENGVVQNQPYIVKLYIKFMFVIVPMIVTILSYFLKLRYPIQNDGIMYLVYQANLLQKKRFEELKRDGYKYYTIEDPVFNRKHINLIIKNENYEKETKELADHFANIEQLTYIYNEEYDKIYKRMKVIIIISIFIFIGSFFTIFFTFGFLANQAWSIIPITFLFLIAISIITLILYIFKIRQIKKAINKEFTVNKKLIKLIIYQKIKNDNHSKFKVDDKKK